MYRACILIVLLTQVWTAFGSSLAPEHELQRLLIVAKESLENANDTRAREALKKISALGIDTGANYFFYLGQLEANSGNSDVASTALIEYVNLSGPEGEYYFRALRLLTKLEEEQVKSTAVVTNELPELLPGERKQYASQLKQLYLTDNTEQALLEHINSILADNIYIPGRIRRSGRNEGLVYKVAINSRKELVIQESDYRQGRSGHSIQSLPVYGVDPYLQSDCDQARRMCWLAHPLESQDKWIIINDNPAALIALSKSLTQLIRNLQN